MDSVWNRQQRTLWEIINRAYPRVLLARRFGHLVEPEEPLPSIVRFQGSATEQEIWRGALGTPNAGQHVVAVMREIESLHEFRDLSQIRDFIDVDEAGEVDTDAQSALGALKKALLEKLVTPNVIKILHARLAGFATKEGSKSTCLMTSHLEQLCRAVQSRLEAMVLQQIDEYSRDALALGRTDRNSYWKATDIGVLANKEHHRAQPSASAGFSSTPSSTTLRSVRGRPMR